MFGLPKKGKDGFLNSLRSFGWSPFSGWYLKSEGLCENMIEILTHRIHGTGIFPYIYHKFMPNVGKYPSPMDPVG